MTCSRISSLGIFSRQDIVWVHFCLPCKEQGRQGMSFCRICTFSPTGKKPHSFVVGPKSASRGVLTAFAKCMGPESPVSKRLHAFKTAQSSRRCVLLIRLLLCGYSYTSPLPTRRIWYSLSRISQSSCQRCRGSVLALWVAKG